MHEDNIAMKKVQLGDQTAYESLVAKHRLAAILFARNFVSDIHTAEDIAQECFAKVYLRAAAYNPAYTFKTYLFTVIHNQCIDYLRKNKNRQTIDLAHAADIPEGDSPEEIVIKQENIREILALLNSLQPDYKTALYLFAVEELSYSEIAQIMKKSIPQIKITIYRARKKIKVLSAEKP